MWPFEFVVHHTPKSQGSGNSRRGGPWQTCLQSAAAKRWTHPHPLTGEFAVAITYFVKQFGGGSQLPDIDNIAKPIVDSLIGLIYDDDRSVTDVLCRRRDLSISQQIDSPSPFLLQNLSGRGDLLYVMVDYAPIRLEHL